MYVPWTKEQVLANISPCFHPDFEKLSQTIIQKNEFILYACNRSITAFYGFTETVRKTWISYYLITQYRRLQVDFWGDDVGILRSEHEGGIFYPQQSFTERIFGKKMDRRFFNYPPYRLGMIMNRHFGETPLSKILDFSRNDFLITPKTKPQFEIVEFKLYQPDTSNRTYITYEGNDGQKVYDLLQQAWQNNGKVSV